MSGRGRAELFLKFAYELTPARELGTGRHARPIVHRRSRTTKTPVESQLHWDGDVFTDDQIIYTVTRQHTRQQHGPTCQTGLGSEPKVHTGTCGRSGHTQSERARRNQKPWPQET